jgi:hypothetical protein
MKENRSIVGPRGWAIVSLAGGSLLAAPFLRSPTSSQLPGFAAAAEAFDGSTFQRTGTLAPASVATDHPASIDPWIERMISGQLPSTLAASPRELPDWVPPPSPLDKLIGKAERAATHDDVLARAEAVAKEKPREFRTWRGATSDLAASASGAPGGGSGPMVWSAPTTNLPNRSLAQHPQSASPWQGESSITAPATLGPTSVAQHALATDTWPDEATAENLQALAAFARGRGDSMSETVDSQRSGDDRTAAAAGQESAAMFNRGGTVSATLRRMGGEAAAHLPSSAQRPSFEYLPTPPEVDSKALSSMPVGAAMVERPFVYQPGIRSPGVTAPPATRMDWPANR